MRGQYLETIVAMCFFTGENCDPGKRSILRWEKKNLGYVDLKGFFFS